MTIRIFSFLLLTCLAALGQPFYIDQLESRNVLIGDSSQMPITPLNGKLRFMEPLWALPTNGVILSLEGDTPNTWKLVVASNTKVDSAGNITAGNNLYGVNLGLGGGPSFSTAGWNGTSWFGNGYGLTNLNAQNLTNTVPLSLLPTNVAYLNSNQTFAATVTNFYLNNIVVQNRIGVATNVPQYPIDVIGTGINGAFAIRVKNTSSGAFQTAEFRIENDTGQSSRIFKLGSGYGTYKTLTSGDLGFYQDPNGGNISILNDSAAGQVILTAGASAEAHMRIRSDGTVGINDNSGNSKLVVSDSGAGGAHDLLGLRGNYSSLGTAQSMTFRDNTSIVGQIDTRYDGTKVDMFFGSLYNSGYNSTVRMTLTGNGRLGIGTTTPPSALTTIGDATVSGSATATNGLYYLIAQTNSTANTGYTNVWQPVHSFAAMMMYTTNTINGGAGAYAIITNYTTARSNLMGCNLTGGYITNTIAGFYRVGVHLSGVALDNSATVEGDLLLNGVAKDEVSFVTVFDNPPRTKGMSAIGILYITNNTPITFQVKSSGASGISVLRAQMVIGSP